MLSELRIQDFAIIDHLELDFGPGLVVFTGETGAGKSIIMDALDMLLGGRADSYFNPKRIGPGACGRHLQVVGTRTPLRPCRPRNAKKCSTTRIT